MRGLSTYFLALLVLATVFAVPEPTRPTGNLRQPKTAVSKESRGKGHEDLIIPVFIDNSQSDIVEAVTDNNQVMTPSAEKLPEGSESNMATVEPTNGDQSQDMTIESSDESREKSHEPRHFGHQTLIKPITSEAECPKGYLLREDHQCHKEVDPQLDPITDTTKATTADDKENYPETGPSSGHQMKHSDSTTTIEPAGEQGPNKNKNDPIEVRGEFDKKSQDSAFYNLYQSSTIVEKVSSPKNCPEHYISVGNECLKLSK